MDGFMATAVVIGLMVVGYVWISLFVMIFKDSLKHRAKEREDDIKAIVNRAIATSSRIRDIENDVIEIKEQLGDK